MVVESSIEAKRYIAFLSIKIEQQSLLLTVLTALVRKSPALVFSEHAVMEVVVECNRAKQQRVKFLGCRKDPATACHIVSRPCTSLKLIICAQLRTGTGDLRRGLIHTPSHPKLHRLY